jgi:peroxiredoxin (alkyl hydroperoxide reductase subunit C)
MARTIDIGEKIPGISAKAYFPEKDEIMEIKFPTGRWTILAFYPGDFTFVCATDIEALTDAHKEFLKNDADVYAVSTDSIFSHKAWTMSSPRAMKDTIPLVEDFNKELSRIFGVLNEATGASRRSVVILDPEGNVEYISIFNDNLGKDVDHIYKAFMGLKFIKETITQKGHMCAIPANWKIGDKPLDIDVVKDIGKL